MNNRKVFLDMISFAEGTYGIGDNGYNVLFGSTAAKPKLFDSYADHPRIKTYETHDEFIRNGKLDYTTAAGRYQITASVFTAYKKILSLPDFSPDSQDSIAVRLISECKALHQIDSGNISNAIFLCSRRWASLPGGDSGQPQRRMAALEGFFREHGGVIIT